MKLLIITQKVDTNDQLLGFFIEWLKKFSQKFDNLLVLCLEKGEYDLPSNVEVISLGKERFENLKIGNSLKIVRQLADWKLKIARRILYGIRFFKFIWQMRRDYDTVFVHMNPIWMVLGGCLWKILNKKRFLWYTSGGVTSKLKIAAKFTDKIFTASRESFRLKSDKVIVTGHGIDTELFKPDSRFQIPDSRFQILSVGRISPVKNYETLVDAVKILADEGVDFNVTLIGEPALDSDKRYLASLKFKVKSLELEDRFNFIGKINHGELPEYYRTNDVFVHLSKTGSLDKTLLEAMACGLNVLSSNDSARPILPPELLFNENSAIELSEKLQFVGQKQYGQMLRTYVLENHNLDKLINKISELIKL